MPLTNSESRRNATAAASSGPRRPRAHVAGERCRVRLLPIVVAVLAALALPTAAQAADVLSVAAPKGACGVLVGRRLVAVGGQAGLRITAGLAVNPRAAAGRYTVTLRLCRRRLDAHGQGPKPPTQQAVNRVHPSGRSCSYRRRVFRKHTVEVERHGRIRRLARRGKETDSRPATARCAPFVGRLVGWATTSSGHSIERAGFRGR